MIRSFMLSFVAVAIFLSTALSQVVAVAEKANPCSQLGSPPQVGQCWDCFQSLLSDCDKNNPSAERRQACYDGANNFLKWCFGRVGNPRKKGADGLDMQRNQGFSYNIFFSTPVDPNFVEVYVRDMHDGEPRMQRVNAFVFSNTDGSLGVFFDNNNLGLENDKVAGVVTVVRNAEGNVESAYADAYNIITPGDLDGNGSVDAFDLSQAWDSYSSGEMSYEKFVEFLTKFSGR